MKRLLDENILKKNVFVSPDLVHKKLSTGSHGRKTSRQMILKNLGLCALVDQKNDKNLAPIHLAAAAGNKFVGFVYLFFCLFLCCCCLFVCLLVVFDCLFCLCNF